MMLESPVQRNLHAGFGGGHSKKDSYIPRRVPTLRILTICYSAVSKKMFSTYSQEDLDLEKRRKRHG
jgi:hypothetical protein